MDVSNRTLAVLLIAAIVFSVGGTLMSFSRVSGPSPTGFATSGSGEVNLTIQETQSIFLNDSSINFGDCSIDAFITSVFDSSGDTNYWNNSQCSEAANLPDNITVSNNGNVNLNLTLTLQTNPTTDYGAGSALGFNASNSSENPGCGGFPSTLQEARVNLTQSTEVEVCTNMSYTNGADEVWVFAQVYIPQGSVAGGDGSNTWLFNARTI